ncbi:MAG: sigma-54-dependent Fis family transcriptional regulator [Deltaproteobacteria bacterium]|nr:sigma-54-dependent Fis family transcriptional regulator [Deltaproteobacteria bacterium]
MVKAIARYLSMQGYDITACEEYDKANKVLQEKPIDLALIDLKLNSHNGLELIRKIKQLELHTKSIIMTGHASIDTAIQAIKEGAFHYLTKPFELIDLFNLTQRALDYSKVEAENQLLKTQLETQRSLYKLIGSSEAMQEVSSLIKRVASTDSTVLILGESGTGKELVAQAIHNESKRTNGPMISVNCAAIPNELLESEMFGHTKGAFTGAQSNRRGRFEMASGGTIFLDEIGDMPPQLQVKLLRVLQEKRIEPLGSGRSIEIDVRILAATNKDLEESVKLGTFREDLYYRLNVIPIQIPALRDRPEDIPQLMDYFFEHFRNEYGNSKPELTPDAKQAFFEYSWPGNVRELENCIERLMILYPGQPIDSSHLPFHHNLDNSKVNLPKVHIPEEGISLKNIVDNFENELILRALERTSGNKNKAASLLKLNRTTLVEKIKKRRLQASSRFFE